MSERMVHLGYEVGSGEPVSIPVRHMAVTGQTQQSGKTTTLEALISRSGLRAIAFVTKRGESGFMPRAGQISSVLSPHFRDRGDWPFVESILESTMQQRMKFERAWIVRACQGAECLADVQRNVERLMQNSKRSMDNDMYMLLGEYLKKVVPLIASLRKGLICHGPEITLHPGLNVMNLLDYPEELQMLVIGATIEWIFKHEQNVVTVIPEAWKFAPQGRKTPVKLVVEKLTREGAGLKNYVWIDSQDMAGVEKQLLRAVSVWLIGVQREANEVKRALGAIPEGFHRPKAAEIATLEVGQFFVCHGRKTQKVYVQPAWLDDTKAQLLAKGELMLSLGALRPQDEGGDDVWKDKYESEHQRVVALEGEVATLKMQLASTGFGRDLPRRARDLHLGELSAVEERPTSLIFTAREEALYHALKDRLAAEAPAILKLLVTKPEIEIHVKRETLSMTTETLDGRIAVLIHSGFFDSPTGNKETLNELERRGWKSAAPRVSESFQRLMKLGFLYKEGEGYRVVAGMKVNIVEAA